MILSLTLLACKEAPIAAPAAAWSLAPVTVGEEVVRIDEPGLRLVERTWEHGGRQGIAWLARLPADAAVTVLPSSTVRPLPDLVPSDGAEAWAAINGGFYEQGPMGLVVSGGVEHSPLTSRGGSGVIFAQPGGGARVVHRDAWTSGPTEALQSIDRLLDAGASLVKARPEARDAARSAVAVGDHLWLVVAAADRSVVRHDAGVTLSRTVGNGLPLYAFADLLLLCTDAREALNMDGAVSTQMIVATKNQNFNIAGELGTINAIRAVPEPPTPQETAPQAADPG